MERIIGNYDGRAEVTLSQWLKVKGGSFITILNGREVSVSVDFNGAAKKVVGGLDMKAIRVAEQVFREVTGNSVCGCSTTEVGVKVSWVRANFTGRSFDECMEDMNREIEIQQQSEDQDGVLRSDAEVVGTAEQYMAGQSMTILRASNEMMKTNVGFVLAAKQAKGRWEGLNFHFDVERSSGWMEWLEGVFSEYADLPEAGEMGSVVGVGFDVPNGGMSDEVFAQHLRLKLTVEPGNMKETDVDQLFWGNGKKPMSQRLRASFVKMVFPEGEMSLADFVGRCRQNLPRWSGYADKKNLGFDDDALILGQMVRARGQLRFSEERATTMVCFFKVTEAWRTNARALEA